MESGKITENFTIAEFLKSDIAQKNGFMEQYHPEDSVIDNIELLCINVLQPIRDRLGSLHVSSGYRCERVNKKAGGKAVSQHTTGHAADIQFFENKSMNNKMIVDTVLENKIKFDQMIWENGGQWVHISYKEGKNRNQYFSV